MVRRLRGFRALALLFLVMALAVSCAGKSVSTDGGDGTPTTGGVGGSGSDATGGTGATGAVGATGGTGATGGVGATGGTGVTGGTGATGAVGATGGTGGTGGDSPIAGSAGSDDGTDPCALPSDAGDCLLQQGYYFDPQTGQCLEFTNGGCNGSRHRFLSRGACLARCAGGEDRTRCDDASECILVQGDCCGCSSLLSDVVAVSKFYDEEFPGILTCPDLPCPPCVAPPSPHLFVTCEQISEEPRQCTAYDARQLSITECVQDSDCRLRRGLECCECGGEIVSVNVNADIEALVCGSQECAIDCDPAFPSGVHPVCRNGRCDTLAELI